VIAVFFVHMEQSDAPQSQAPTKYLKLTEDLAQLKADFNAADDKIRLVFVSGPSCGIRLRGLDELNRSIVASLQKDPCVHTFVIHVPTLGAEEEHVQASIPLMSGPRISHCWDEVGNSGPGFQESLDIPMCAWDVWMVYGPEQVWESDGPPPKTIFWQHQLPSLPKKLRVDAVAFAEFVSIEPEGMPEMSGDLSQSAAQPDATGIIPVAQPRGVMIHQNHLTRGGYPRVKSIPAIRYERLTEVRGHSLSLTIEN
jgi:hypothetical protein